LENPTPWNAEGAEDPSPEDDLDPVQFGTEVSGSAKSAECGVVRGGQQFPFRSTGDEICGW